MDIPNNIMSYFILFSLFKGGGALDKQYKNEGFIFLKEKVKWAYRQLTYL